MKRPEGKIIVMFPTLGCARELLDIIAGIIDHESFEQTD
jgi:hypothetical protein